MNETPKSVTKENPQNMGKEQLPPNLSSFGSCPQLRPLLTVKKQAETPNWTKCHWKKRIKILFFSPLCLFLTLLYLFSTFLSPSLCPSVSPLSCSQRCRSPPVRRSHPSRFCFTPERKLFSSWRHIYRGAGTRSWIVESLLLSPYPSPTGTYMFPTRVHFPPNPPPFHPSLSSPPHVSSQKLILFPLKSTQSGANPRVPSWRHIFITAVMMVSSASLCRRACVYILNRISIKNVVGGGSGLCREAERRLHFLILYLKAAVNSLHLSRRKNDTLLLCCCRCWTHPGQQELKVLVASEGRGRCCREPRVKRWSQMDSGNERM